MAGTDIWRRLPAVHGKDKKEQAAPQAGVLVYVIGPSGAGKDALISHVKDMPADAQAARPLHVARRRITRPAGDRTENHQAMAASEFARACREGEFVMHWESHGFSYGIGREIDGWLAADAVVIVNGSRAYLPEARKTYPRLIPVLVRVNQEILRQRLINRGRETPEEIEERIRRASLAVPDVPGLIVINNSSSLEDAVLAFSLFIKELRRHPTTPPGRRLAAPRPDAAPA
ncbi:MAG: phosphonate metabolism protein/1,5-bisphosphokinase (PRPP-forming) PhnN [Desulfovibrio sp.]|jgi:ribose 1,5-bisphosphokinase|nr:phosphonate metabolism protein/1,5-bisphosphokinase (PRPP-forming) PhnN [Desulfovibrio sp.]